MTLAQMRLFLKEGSLIKRKVIATEARAMRVAMWSEAEAFDKFLDNLEK